MLRLTAASSPLDAVVTVPGSKSIANRALVCAALADGDSRLRGMPGGDDTVAMVSLPRRRSGSASTMEGDDAVVDGSGGVIGAARRRARRPPRRHDVALRDRARRAGARDRSPIDGAPPLRRRPMGPLHDALAALGVTVEPGEAAGGLPVTVSGPLTMGGTVAISGDVSSQYLTALMLIAPLPRRRPAPAS